MASMHDDEIDPLLPALRPCALGPRDGVEEVPGGARSQGSPDRGMVSISGEPTDATRSCARARRQQPRDQQRHHARLGHRSEYRLHELEAAEQEQDPAADLESCKLLIPLPVGQPSALRTTRTILMHALRRNSGPI